MPDRASQVWNCRESRQARAQLDMLCEKNAKFDQIWTAVRWLIIRSPSEAGRLVPGKEQTYVLKTEDFMAIGMPVIMVTYSITNAAKRVCEIVSVLDATVSHLEQVPAKTETTAASAKPKTA